MPRCLIALGGNLGPVAETFAAALRRLDVGPDTRVVSTSGIHLSPAVGDRAGGEFRNAAAEVDTRLPALSLLDRLQAIESEFGRTHEIHWGPRTLDLDLILYGAEIIRSPRLHVPHPACWYRRFVLDPVVEIAPHAVHPEKGRTFAELQARLLERPLCMGISGGDHRKSAVVTTALGADFADASVTEWQPDDPEPALLAWLGPGPHAPRFEDLPIVSRLDASVDTEHPGVFLRHVLHAALGR